MRCAKAVMPPDASAPATCKSTSSLVPQAGMTWSSGDSPSETHTALRSQSQPNPGSDAHGISLACLHRAVDCWDSLKHHALRVFSMGQSTPLESAHMLQGKLGQLLPEFTLWELQRKCWRGLRDEKVLGEALDLLVDHEYLFEREPAKHPKGGRPPSRIFMVNLKSSEEA